MPEPANIKAKKLRVFGRKRYDVAALWEIIFLRHRKAILSVDNGKAEEDVYAAVKDADAMKRNNRLLCQHNYNQLYRDIITFYWRWSEPYCS